MPFTHSYQALTRIPTIQPGHVEPVPLDQTHLSARVANKIL